LHATSRAPLNMALEGRRMSTPEFTPTAVRLSRTFFLGSGGVFFVLAALVWLAGPGFMVTLAATGLGLVAFALLSSAQLCASVASKIAGLIGFPF
jgi:hypothetical protein